MVPSATSSSTTPPAFMDDNVLQQQDNSPRATATAALMSDSSTISTFECEEYKRLFEILSCPSQLAHFQAYLQSIHAHENLLFIEALSELRHEKCSKNIETIVHR